LKNNACLRGVKDNRDNRDNFFILLKGNISFKNNFFCLKAVCPQFQISTIFAPRIVSIVSIVFKNNACGRLKPPLAGSQQQQALFLSLATCAKRGASHP